jgi:hypothetical protein
MRACVLRQLLRALDRCDCNNGHCFFQAIKLYLYRSKHSSRRTRYVFNGPRVATSIDDVSAFTAMNPQLPPITVLGLLPLELATVDNVFFPLLQPDGARFMHMITVVFDRGHFALVNKDYLLFRSMHSTSVNGTYTCWRHARAFRTLNALRAHASCCLHEPMAVAYSPTVVPDFLETHYAFWVRADVRVYAVSAAALISIAERQWPDWLFLETRRAGDAFELRALVKLRPWDPAFEPGHVDELLFQLPLFDVHPLFVTAIVARLAPYGNQFVTLRLVTKSD